MALKKESDGIVYKLNDRTGERQYALRLGEDGYWYDDKSSQVWEASADGVFKSAPVDTRRSSTSTYTGSTNSSANHEESGNNPSITDILAGNPDNSSERGLLGGYDQLPGRSVSDVGSAYDAQGGTVGTPFTVSLGDGSTTNIPFTDINIPGQIDIGNPAGLNGAPTDARVGDSWGSPQSSLGQYYAAHPNEYYGEMQMPVIYGGKVEAPLIGVDKQFEFKNPLDMSKFEQNPVEQNAQVLEQDKQEQNVQTFDSVKRGGSFEIKTASDRPFGGQKLEEAFIKSPLQSFGDVSNNKERNSTYRWA